MNYKIINGKKVLTAECINVFGYGVIEEILSDAGDLYPPKRHILRCKLVNKPALENYLKN